VNYPYLVKTSHEGVIQVSVKFKQCLIYGKLAQVQLVWWCHILDDFITAEGSLSPRSFLGLSSYPPALGGSASETPLHGEG